jgi:hypothetical protein
MFYLIIYGVVNNLLISLGYVVWNDKMISEYRI